MLGRSHAAIGAAAAVATAHVLGAEHVLGAAIRGPAWLAVVSTVALAGPVGAVAALLPDLDEPGSTLGRLLPGWWHRLTPGHRRCTHSLAVAAVGGSLRLALGALGVGGFALALLSAVVVAGMLSHLAADAITERGIPLFWPWQRRLGLPLFRTGSPLEHGVVLLAVLGVAWWALGLGEVVRTAGGGLR